MGKKLAPSVSLEQGEQQDRETQLNHEMRLMVEERRIYQLEVRFDSLTVDLVGNISSHSHTTLYIVLAVT